MSQIKILWVDDEIDLLKPHILFLEKKNYHVTTCNNGQDAIELFDENNFDIVFLDENMPGLSGLEVAKMCHEKEIQTKIILLTFHKESYIYQQAKSLNISGYMTKDFDLEELLDCIDLVSKNETYLNEKILPENLSGKLNDKPVNLTPTEIKIIRYIADGLTTKDISGILFVAERTVDKHRSNIIKKLDLDKKHNSLLLWAQKNKEIIY